MIVTRHEEYVTMHRNKGNNEPISYDAWCKEIQDKPVDQDLFDKYVRLLEDKPFNADTFRQVLVFGYTMMDVLRSDTDEIAQLGRVRIKGRNNSKINFPKLRK